MSSQELLFMRVIQIRDHYATPRDIDKVLSVRMKPNGPNYSTTISNCMF